MMDRFQARRSGIALVTASALLWSTAGLFVRMADLDTWTLVAWRSLFSFLTLCCIVAWQHRTVPARSLAGIGWPGDVAVALLVLSTISYVMALRLTTVANVMIVYAALPFVATAIAFVWLGQRVTARFLAAGSITLAGIAIMAGDIASPRDLAGLLAALVMTCGFAMQLVHTRRHPTIDVTLIVALGAGVCGLITLPLMQPGLPAPKQLLACALFGILTTGLAYVLALRGGRLMPPGEAGLISMLDVVLGPMWVWLFYSESPSLPVLAGGVLVVISVAWYLSAQGGMRTSAGETTGPTTPA